jgi:hypothetical protein
MKPPRTNLYRAYRRIERMLFFGVPEQPEPMWEREGSNESGDRVTGRPLVSGNSHSVSIEEAETLATISYNPDSCELVYESHTSRQPQETK